MPELDELWIECASGEDDWQSACDLLVAVAPLGAEYSEFGDPCGRRNEPSDGCEILSR